MPYYSEFKDIERSFNAEKLIFPFFTSFMKHFFLFRLTYLQVTLPRNMKHWEICKWFIPGYNLFQVYL